MEQYNIEAFQSCEDRGYISLPDHKLRIDTLDSVEDDDGNVIHYYTRVVVAHNDKSYSEIYFITPEESNYYTFVETYNKLCNKAGIKPVEWQ